VLYFEQEWSALYLFGSLGSNLGSETDYTEDVCGFRQGFPGKYRDSIPNYTTNTSFHILSTSYGTNGPIIRRQTYVN